MELLIVIVVIAILASISVVAYNGIQDRAEETKLQSDLRQAANLVTMDYALDGAYPANESAVNEGQGFSPSDGTRLQYDGAADSYCITASSTRRDVRAFYISSDTGTIREGVCDGHEGYTGGVVPPAISTTSLPDGTQGTAYSATIEVSGDTPMTFAIEFGSLPSGLSLNSSTGLISGTPTWWGSSNFTVRVTNAAGGENRDLTLEIVPPAPQITTTSLPDGQVGQQYSAYITTVEGAAPTFSVASGSLPPGLSLSQGGQINGFPSQSGQFTFTVTATHSGGSDSQSLSINIGSGHDQGAGS